MHPFCLSQAPCHSGPGDRAAMCPQAVDRNTGPAKQHRIITVFRWQKGFGGAFLSYFYYEHNGCSFPLSKYNTVQFSSLFQIMHVHYTPTHAHVSTPTVIYRPPAQLCLSCHRPEGPRCPPGKNVRVTLPSGWSVVLDFLRAFQHCLWTCEAPSEF